MLMRELLDNRNRTARVKYWPLATLVQDVTARVQRIRGDTQLEAAMSVFQTIGAIAYYAAAGSTMRKVLDLGPEIDLDAPFRTAMQRVLDDTLHGAGTRPRKQKASRT